MALNCVAFGIIVSCYMKMYCSIRGSQAWNSNDFRVAKRMALLVFTDFACWAPIAFFSLTAAFGYDLISLNDAKVCLLFYWLLFLNDLKMSACRTSAKHDNVDKGEIGNG